VPTSPIPTGPGAASLVREFAVVCPEGEVAARGARGSFTAAERRARAIPTSHVRTLRARRIASKVLSAHGAQVADDCIPKCQAAINGAPHAHCCTVFSKHGQLAMPRV
jgi:hypothetical protein